MFAQAFHIDWPPQGSVQQGGWEGGASEHGRRQTEISSSRAEELEEDGVECRNCGKTFALPVKSCDDPQIRFKSQFVIIPHSPVNLLGRDLLFKLECSLTFTNPHT